MSKGGPNLISLSGCFLFTVCLWVHSLLIPSVSVFASSFNLNSSLEVPVFTGQSVNGPPSCSHDSFSIHVFLQTFYTFFPVSCCLVAAVLVEVSDGCVELAVFLT